MRPPRRFAAGGAPTASSAAALICQHRYDVVIVGAGGAGMRAAVEAGPR
ncbi:FAD-binding protein, partial [Mycobacterium tuberculosis]